MHFIRLRTNQDERYQTAMELYKNSFPLFEQREDQIQIEVLNHEDFCFNLIYDDEIFVGIILFWESEHVIYVEHFCINPQLRGKTYGKRALEILKQQKKPVILEIDPPVDEISRRRKEFYQRADFKVNDFIHIHPPYRKGFQGHELRILSYPELLSEDEYDNFNQYLRKTVMGVAMTLQIVDKNFSVYKVKDLPGEILDHEFTFISRTDRELSVISETHLVPKDCLIVEHGWNCFRIAEDASFGKYGMIAFLANIIAAEKTSTLVVGTYDTDYLMIKKEKFQQVIQALKDHGCFFI